ncbi:MAG: 7-cyano-7-deazaguanine synthase QueC [Magnetococcus sp. YQC-3]
MSAEQARPKAVVLLSGGMDSAVCLHLARAEGFAVHALSFRYGQRHGLELQQAKELAVAALVQQHLVFDLPVEAFAGSALTGALLVPKEGPGEGIPVTYVPARNTVFLSLALAWAETLGAQDLFIGVNAVDFSGYPDCRPAFIAAFEQLANVATRGGPYRIHAPLLSLSKAEIVRRGVALGVDFARTLSCYDPDRQGRACGSCDACRLRLAGFAAVGVPDPAAYRSA